MTNWNRKKIPRFLGGALANCCYDIYPEELYGELVDCFERNLVDTFMIDKNDLDRSMRMGKGQILAKLKADRHSQFIDGVITILGHQQEPFQSTVEMQMTAPLHLEPAVEGDEVSDPILMVSQQATSTPKQSNQQKTWGTNTLTIPVLLIPVGWAVGGAVEWNVGGAYEWALALLWTTQSSLLIIVWAIVGVISGAVVAASRCGVSMKRVPNHDVFSPRVGTMSPAAATRQ